MFTNRDLVQGLLYISPYIHQVVTKNEHKNEVNTFMVTVNRLDEMMLVQAGRQSKMAERLSEMRTQNTVMVHRRTNCQTFFLSAGFLYDNFDQKLPKKENNGAFIVPETGDLMLARSDFEFLIEE